MKKIFLSIVLILLAMSTASALDPVKVAIVNTSTVQVSVEVKLTNYASGTGVVLYTQAATNYTPNGSGIIVANISGAGWTAIAPNTVTTSYILDVYVGGILASQYRLDQLLLAQSQGGVFDTGGNLTPAENGNGTVGTDDKRWESAFLTGNTVHIGPAGGEADDTELALSYNAGIARLKVDNVTLIEADDEVITFKKLVSQDIGNGTTGFGKDALKNNTGTNVSAFGANAAKDNSGNDLTAIGYNSAEGNTRKQVTVIGHASGKGNIGEQLTAVGVDAGRSNSGDDLTAVGYNSGKDNTGADATLIGVASGRENTGSNVTAIGENSARKNVAANVIAIGTSAGYAGAVGNTNNNIILIGNSVSATANNQVVIGDPSMTQTNLHGVLNVPMHAVIDGITVGQGAGDVATNTAVGVSALSSNTTGNGNTSIGSDALKTNTTGSVNTAIGHLALQSNEDGDNNTATGRASLQANTSGDNNTAMGRASLYLNSTGSNNTATGGEAMRDNESGNSNTANGVNSLRKNKIGNFNTANGEAALFNNTEGNNNTATGRASLFINSTGNNNTASGDEALRNNETGNNNLSLGVRSGYKITTGSNNLFLGYKTGDNALQKIDAQNSIAIGANAFTTADNQVVIGDANITETNLHGVLNVPMHAVIDGITVGQGAGDVATNTAVGVSALSSNTTGSENTAIGGSALTSNLAGFRNTAIGYQALQNNTSGTNNTANGYNAGNRLESGSNNIFIGRESGSVMTTQKVDAVSSIAIGFLANTQGDNSIAIGTNAATTADNQVVIGNSSITETKLQGDVKISGGITANPSGDNTKEFKFGDDDLTYDGAFPNVEFKMFFSSGAFRAGGVNSNAWDILSANIGAYSFATGINTIANNDYSTALGNGTTASGESSTSMGNGTTASGRNSTALGINSIASGNNSTAVGSNTTAKSLAETSIGSYNTDYTIDTDGDTQWKLADRLFVIGNGANSGSKSDAMIVKKNGDVWTSGFVQNKVTDATSKAEVTSAKTSVINYTFTDNILNIDLPTASAGTFLYLYCSQAVSVLGKAITAGRTATLININGTTWSIVE